jgi:PAS domain S-box-containing protein
MAGSVIESKYPSLFPPARVVFGVGQHGSKMRGFPARNKQITERAMAECHRRRIVALPHHKMAYSVSTMPEKKGDLVKDALRILNLEDNENDAELNGAMLSARWPQCQLVRVDNRRDYLAALEQGNIDVILSDYTMPGFDGRTALALAREKRPEIPFLFVSGTIGEDSAIEALKNGATDYVLKHRLLRMIPAVDRALRDADERAECQRAEEAMRQSEYKYRELFESLGDAAFLADEESGKIIDTNRCAEILLGCPRAEILGRKQSQFLALDQARATEAGTKTKVACECKMICADGSSLPVEVRTARLTLYDRPLVLRLCHDLSEVRRAQ